MGKDKKKKKPGPEPDKLKLEGDWGQAVKKALTKKRPKGGWPNTDKPNSFDL